LSAGVLYHLTGLYDILFLKQGEKLCINSSQPNEMNCEQDFIQYSDFHSGNVCKLVHI